MPVNEAVQHLEGADIVAFSTYVWNYGISLEIAKRLKEKDRGILIVFGGPHVPDRAERFLREHPFVDLACHGEGESVFLNVLEIYHSRKWDRVPSVSFLDKNTFRSTSHSKRIQDLSTIPSPYLEGVFDGLIEKYPDKEWLGLWETNRGCPFSCTFCDWGSATKSQLYTFDMERLKLEIEWFAGKRVEFIFCCDSNFGIRKRDLKLAEYVADIKKKFDYPKALSVQNTKNVTDRAYDIQKVLSDAELNKGVTMALQTVDKTTLDNIGRQNISLKSFEELQKRFKDEGIVTYTDLILALPGETYDSFTKGVETVIDNGQYNRIQFINLSILPNAQMGDPVYQRKHGMIIIETKIINIHGSLAGSEDDIEETQHLVVGTDTMPEEDWLRARVFSWMISLLFFDKLMQIPFVLLHKILDCSYRQLVELFMDKSLNGYPITATIRDLFRKEARKIQQGGLEYCKSRDWLNIYWPHDEYVFIMLCVENKLEAFYKEAEALLGELLRKKGQKVPLFLHEAILLNKSLIKKPGPKKDILLNLRFNIWEYYQSAMSTNHLELGEAKFKYHIDRHRETWPTLDEWLREIVWYGNKKGAYLYDLKTDGWE
jgi:tRNA A37 methylthiotransferase MiaB